MASSWKGLNHCRLRRAIPKVLIDIMGHSCFGLQIMIVGSNMTVGIKIFNIVKGLNFVGGLNHGFVRMLLVMRVLCLLRRLRKIVLV